MTEESLLVTGERGGGLGVAGLHPVRGGGTGMAIDREGGAEADHTLSGIGSPSPCQEIGLVTVMFFFELLFSYVLALNFLLCFLSYLIFNHFIPQLFLIQDTQSEGHQEGGSLVTGNSQKSFNNLRSLLRLLDQLFDPTVDLLLTTPHHGSTPSHLPPSPPSVPLPPHWST